MRVRCLISSVVRLVQDMIDDEMQGDGQGERQELTGTLPGRSEGVIYSPLRALGRGDW